LQNVIGLYSDDDKFLLIGYSFGTLLTIELARILELTGKQGAVAFIDGSPQFIHRLSHIIIPDSSNNSFIQNMILFNCIRVLKPEEFTKQSAKIMAVSTWESKLQTFIDFAKTKSHYSESYGSTMVTKLMRTVKIALKADKFQHSILDRTPTTLFKAQQTAVKGIDDDYGLGKYTQFNLDVQLIDADHFTILSKAELFDKLHSLI